METETKKQLEIVRPFYVYGLIQSLTTKRIVIVRYKKQDQSLLKFFELRNEGNNCYSDQRKTLTLYSVLEDQYEEISEFNIEYFTDTSTDVDQDFNFTRRHKLKECYQFYKQKIKKLGLDYDLDKVFFDSELITPADLPKIISLNIQNVHSFYEPTSEQREKYKQTLLMLLNQEANKQKEMITKEFNLLQKENSSLDTQELEAILSFIDTTLETTNFENCNTIGEMFADWPTIITSPISKWIHQNPWN